MADGSMPLGGDDAVDPELAQFDYLRVPNAPESSVPAFHARVAVLIERARRKPHHLGACAARSY
jgi:hypothetical protein